MSNLNLDEFEKIRGEIYKITNIKNDMIYIGQTRTHRKNKNKYRYFGFIGRFKDHLSEALKNNKKKQCTYLNNAIRLEKESFKVELIETCSLNELDEKEKFYIEKFNSYYPNGYNLTKGGRTFSSNLINSNEPLNKPKIKRGRNFGYKHTEETKNKMRSSLQSISHLLKIKASDNDQKNKTSKNIIKYYDEQKIKKLANINLDMDVESYIKPLKDKKQNICGYKIYIDRQHVFKACSKRESLPDIYNRLKNILLKSKNSQDLSKEK